MAMIYTVKVSSGKGQTYEGFSNAAFKSWAYLEKMNPTALLAVVWIEGEVDMWWIENEGAALEELKRMYRADRGVDDVQVHIFRTVRK